MSEQETAAGRDEWWTEQRRELWERIDEATERVIASYDADGRFLGGLSLHASAPNPHGINADIAPDEWYVTIPYAEDRVDVETLATRLAEELETGVRIQPRTDEWAPGVWLILDGIADTGGEDDA